MKLEEINKTMIPFPEVRLWQPLDGKVRPNEHGTIIKVWIEKYGNKNKNLGLWKSDISGELRIILAGLDPLLYGTGDLSIGWYLYDEYFILDRGTTE